MLSLQRDWRLRGSRTGWPLGNYFCHGCFHLLNGPADASIMHLREPALETPPGVMC